MSDLAEAEAAVRAARAVAPDLPVVATLSFDTNLRTMMGVTPGRRGDRARARWASTRSAPTAAAARRRWRSSSGRWPRCDPTGLLLIAQSNAGLPVLVGDHFEYDKPRRPTWPSTPAGCRRPAST